VSIGSIVIPAHNEAAVIARTLQPLTALTEHGVEIVVSANGCLDDTADIARTFDGITVVETDIPSKPAALNAADAVASRFPRLYLDADVTITADGALAVLERLSLGDVLAARPAFRYDTTGADRLVAAYYRARDRMPQMHQHLWGAGVYALSEQAHTRLGSFPLMVADDLYVDELFNRNDIDIVDTEPALVRCPRTWDSLLSTLRRVQGGRIQLERSQEIQSVGGVVPVLAAVRGPIGLLDSVVYGAFSLAARLLSVRHGERWRRDESARLVPKPAATNRAHRAGEVD